MGSTTKEGKISETAITDNIRIKEDGSLAAIAYDLSVDPPTKLEIDVKDEFMQQKLKLALINIWIWNGNTNKERATSWAKGIIESKKYEFFMREAKRILRVYG